MHKLMGYICNEMEDLERKADKGKLSMAEIEYLDKLAHIKKSILTADELWDESEYSEASDPSYRSNRTGGRYSRGSYARRRDNMGRYSREGYMDGYSGEFRADLESLIEDAPNEQIKRKLRQMMQEM